MLNRLAVAFLGLSLAAPASAFATDWSFDPAHTAAHFAVKHMLVSTVRGEFSKVGGTVKVDDKDITKSSVEATIDVATVNTREGKRDEHLKSPDFFDVAKFPAMTFKSKKIAKAGDGYKITGDLTIHGVTKEVTLDASGLAPEQKDPWGNIRSGLEATTKVSRKDFNIGGGTPTAIVGDEVTITLDIELMRKAPAAK